MDGILIIDKEKGYTSSDVVAKLRGILHQKKIGHAGTLDPDATGVLVVLLGKATKLSTLLMGGGKRYRAVMRLGVVTDTQDMSGTVLEEREPVTDRQKICDVLTSFEGTYDQVPPMYSAVKVNGKKLYQYARSGREVERTARPVTIERIGIEEIAPPLVRFAADCSKGTYIRTLCHDIGERLGCGAAMEELCRTGSGRFTLDDAVRIGEVRQRVQDGTIGQVLTGLEDVLLDYPSFTCAPEHEKALLNGNRLETGWGEGTPAADGLTVVRDHQGTIRALYRLNAEDGMLHPDVMLL